MIGLILTPSKQIPDHINRRALFYRNKRDETRTSLEAMGNQFHSLFLFCLSCCNLMFVDKRLTAIRFDMVVEFIVHAGLIVIVRQWYPP